MHYKMKHDPEENIVNLAIDGDGLPTLSINNIDVAYLNDDGELSLIGLSKDEMAALKKNGISLNEAERTITIDP